MAVQALPVVDAPEKTTFITGEVLARMGDLGRTELVRGVIVPMSPTGYPHGRVENQIGRLLGNFVSAQGVGEVVSGEVGVYTHRQPDTVRAPDVAFISNERLAQVKSKSYLDVAPELIVEVMSPDDAWGELMDKLEEYFAVGVRLIWVADPRKQRLYVYRSTTEARQLNVSDTLTGEEVLPGFSVSVAELFAVE